VQNKTLSLVPKVEKVIADIQHENYHIPMLAHGERELIQRDRELPASGVYTFTEADYVDGREEAEYQIPDLPLRTINDAVEVQRLSRLNTLLERMVVGSSISIAELKAALTLQQYEDYLDSVTNPKQVEEVLYGSGMPEDLRSYNRKLQAADFQNAKYEKMASMRNRGLANYRAGVVRKAQEKAEHLYERALERLEEIWGVASTGEKQILQSWMDREVDFDAGPNNRLGLDVTSVPRVRGSKSRAAQASGLPKLSQKLKRTECQLSAVLAAATAIVFEPEKESVFSEEQIMQLKQRMERIHNLSPEKD
jgi:hypothetical protein